MLFCLSHGYHHQILHLADQISLFAADFLRPLHLNLRLFLQFSSCATSTSAA